MVTIESIIFIKNLFNYYCKFIFIKQIQLCFIFIKIFILNYDQFFNFVSK